MKQLRQVFNEVKMGYVVAQCGGHVHLQNSMQLNGVRLMLLGSTLAPLSAFATSTGSAPTVQTSVSNMTQMVTLFFKLIAVVAALAGFVYFVCGIVWAIKKSKPEFATQITAGQVFGGLLGGPALAVAGVLFFMVINSFYGSSSAAGQGVTLSTS